MFLIARSDAVNVYIYVLCMLIGVNKSMNEL